MSEKTLNSPTSKCFSLLTGLTKPNLGLVERVLAACRIGSLEQLQEALAEGPCDLNATDAVGNTALNLS